MSMTGRSSAASLPTLPTGVEVASWATYLEAQKAVDHLSDKDFPVRNVTIVGTDLLMVERITGRLTHARVAGAGAMSGAWFGLMIGLLYWLFSPGGEFPVLAAVLIGAAFGILFAVVSYAFGRGRRDFTSASQVVATRYALLCAAEHAGQARQLLTEGGFGGRVRQPAPGEGGAWGRHSGPAAPPAGPGTTGAPPTHPADAHPSGAPPAGASPAGAQPAAAPMPQEVAPAAGPPAPGRGGGGERPRYGLRLEDLEPDQRGAGGQDDDGHEGAGRPERK